MENCLQKNPDINLVYTINEPARRRRLHALKTAGKDKDVMIVSVDGGCDGVKDGPAGMIAATSQQYPLKMAAMGVEAGVEYARSGKKPSGYTDTGVELITGRSWSPASSPRTSPTARRTAGARRSGKAAGPDYTGPAARRFFRPDGEDQA